MNKHNNIIHQEMGMVIHIRDIAFTMLDNNLEHTDIMTNDIQTIINAANMLYARLHDQIEEEE